MLRKIKFASEAKKLLSKNGVHHGIQFHSSQVVMVQCLQPKGCELESTYVLFFFFFLYFYLYSIRLTSFIINVPRPLSNFLWIVIFKRLMRNANTEPVCLEYLRASK